MLVSIIEIPLYLPVESPTAAIEESWALERARDAREYEEMISESISEFGAPEWPEEIQEQAQIEMPRRLTDVSIFKTHRFLGKKKVI